MAAAIARPSDISDELWSACLHEGAHALVGHATGARIDCVTVKAHGTTLGRTYAHRRARPLDEGEARRRGMYLCAGAVADRLVGVAADLIEKGASTDRRSLEALAKRYAGTADSPEFRCLLTTLWERDAEALLGREAPAWLALAQKLVTAGTLLHEDVTRTRKVCRRRAACEAAQPLPRETSADEVDAA